MTINSSNKDSATASATGGQFVKHKRRYCKVEGCDRIVKSQGLCQRHGAKPRQCRISDCPKQAQGNFDGMCKSHFRIAETSKNEKEKTTSKPKERQNPTASFLDRIIPESVMWTNRMGTPMPFISHLIDKWLGIGMTNDGFGDTLPCFPFRNISWTGKWNLSWRNPSFYPGLPRWHSGTWPLLGVVKKTSILLLFKRNVKRKMVFQRQPQPFLDRKVEVWPVTRIKPSAFIIDPTTPKFPHRYPRHTTSTIQRYPLAR